MEDGSLNARVARAGVRGVGRPSPRICCLPSLCVATAPPVAGMTWAGRLLLTFLLVSNMCGCDPGPSDQFQDLRRATFLLLEDRLEYYEGIQDPESQYYEEIQDPESRAKLDRSCAEIRRILRVLRKTDPESPVPATPYGCELAHGAPPKDTPHRRILLQWVATADEVSGFFLEFDEQKLEFSVLDSKSEGVQEPAAETAYRFDIVHLLDASTEKADDFKDLVKYGSPHISLPPEVLDRLFSPNRGPISVGLLLSDGTRSPTCELGVFSGHEK